MGGWVVDLSWVGAMQRRVWDRRKYLEEQVLQAGGFDPLVDLPSLPMGGDMQLISWRKLYLHYSYTCLKHLSKCLGCILQCGSGYWDFLLLPFGTVNWKKAYQVIFRSGRKCSRKEFYPIIVLKYWWCLTCIYFMHYWNFVTPGDLEDGKLTKKTMKVILQQGMDLLQT